MKCKNIKCDKEHNGSLGSGKYCSRQCSNSRNWTDEDKVKKSFSAGGTGVLKVKKEKLIRLSRERKCIGCEVITYNKKFCNRACEINFKKGISKEKLKISFENGTLKYRSQIHTILVERDGNKCSGCGISDWRGKGIRLWVDHIDGNATNNNPNNFRLICPNCDSQSSTFGARNKGKGRGSLGLKPCD